jgi:hypothetical protein
VKKISTVASFLGGLIIVSALIAVGCVDEDKEDWQAAEEANTVEAFEEYLQEHPDGKYVTEAREGLEELHWQAAEEANTVEAFEEYLQEHPDGKYVTEARGGLEELHWQAAEEANTVEAFGEYLQDHPDGKYAVQARERIDDLDWQEAQAANTIVAYRQYLASHPAGGFVPQAEEAVASLINDQSPFLAAQELGTRKAYEGFLAEFPGHVREADARRALDDILRDMEGRRILDLIAQNKVRAEANGSGIEEVELELCRLVKHQVTVLVPVGTFFVSRGSAQDMVTTDDEEFTLEEECISVTVPVACADFDRSVPRSDDTFDILPGSQQEELERLMPLVADAPFSVRQAAVWVVTDNADYEDLGTLVSGPIAGFGSRVIHETQAAQAMKLVDEAGIDITQKGIWRDRDLILQGLEDGTLKNWLQQRAG